MIHVEVRLTIWGALEKSYQGMNHSLIPQIFFVPCTPRHRSSTVNMTRKEPDGVPCSVGRQVTNKQIRPFQGAKHTLRKIRTAVCEGRLLDSVDFFQWRRASQRRCLLSWDLNSEAWGKSCLDRGQRKQEGANAGSSRAGGKTGRRVAVGGKGWSQAGWWGRWRPGHLDLRSWEHLMVL